MSDHPDPGDLDRVLGRAGRIWPADVAREWLTGSEPYLDDARPIDVLRLRGPGEVLDALDAIEQGALG